MGESDGAWGQLVEHDPEMAEFWDSFSPLPEPGESAILDDFLARKNLDMAALHRLGAKLKSATELAFVHNGTGLKWRDMVTGGRGAYRGSKYALLRILSAQIRPAAGIVVCEGETDAARLTMLYPELDVGMLGAGAKSFTKIMAAQVSNYDRVFAGLDRDTAGEAGAQKIIDMVEGAQRLAPPATDWCDVADGDSIPPLPDAPDVVKIGTVIFPNLERVLAGSLEPPSQLVDDFLYVEGVHWVDGEPGCGKSSLLLSYCADLMAEQKHIVWIDFEGGIKPTLRRLKSTGCPDSLIVPYFHYAGWPEKIEEQIQKLAENWPGAPIIIDSASKALASAGVDENSNSEVTQWMGQIVRVVKALDVPLVIIDHISKSAAAGKSMYARGAGSKLADCDVHWRIEKEIPFSMHERGLISAKQHKDREGTLPFKFWCWMGDGDGALEVGPKMDSDPTDEKDAPADGAFSPNPEKIL